MNDNWQDAIRERLTRWNRNQSPGDDQEVTIGIIRNLGGSGFAQIDRIDTSIGQFVVKQTFGNQPATDQAAHQFLTEGRALQQLGQQTEIRVPKVIALPEPGFPFLISEFIARRSSDSGFEKDFGHRLARMHQALVGERFGWESSNFLGATPQSNDWQTSWSVFWMQQRMVPQWKLAAQQGFPEVEKQGRELERDLEQFLNSRSVTPTLIHGDLWSGNFWSDDDGKPVIIDPACYFADPVAELGMTSLFGGLGADFVSAYQDLQPLPENATTLIAIYRWYHLLNHLNLFGRSYLTQVQLEATELKKILRRT